MEISLALSGMNQTHTTSVSVYLGSERIIMLVKGFFILIHKQESIIILNPIVLYCKIGFYITDHHLCS
jgi:hypothetical protein